jgi:hypothetical protein
MLPKKQMWIHTILWRGPPSLSLSPSRENQPTTPLHNHNFTLFAKRFIDIYHSNTHIHATSPDKRPYTSLHRPQLDYSPATISTTNKYKLPQKQWQCLTMNQFSQMSNGCLERYITLHWELFMLAIIAWGSTIFVVLLSKECDIVKLKITIIFIF